MWISVRSKSDVISAIAAVVCIFLAPVASHAQWQRIGSCAFRGIDHLSSGRIVMVTDGGSLYSSVDGGDTWTCSSVAQSMMLTCVSFADDSHGLVGAVASGKGAVLTTSDGGRSWVRHESPDFLGVLSVSSPTADTLYASCAIGSGKVFRSTDAGNSWTRLSLPTNDAVFKVHFVTGRSGFVTGDTGLVAVTYDAGVTWSTLATEFSGVIRSVDWRGRRVAIAGTDKNGNGLLALSGDSGQHWTRSAFSDTLAGDMTVVKLLAGDTVVAFESSNFFRCTSTDFGATWQIARLAPDYVHDKYLPVQLYDAYVDPNGNGLVCGGLGTLYRLTDRGMAGYVQSHCAVGTTPQSHAGAQLEALAERPSLIHGIGDGGGLTVTTDQGLTWFTHQDPNYDKVQYTGLHFVSASQGVLLTTMGLQQYYSPFQSTNDTGRTWRIVETERTSKLYSSLIAKDGNLYALGDSIAIRSSDGGASWRPYCRYWRTAPPSSGCKVLRTILSDGEVWPDGSSCFLVYEIDSFFDAGADLRKLAYPVYSTIRSKDGGQLWSDPVYFPEGIYINDLAFIDQNLGYAVGNASNLFRTTDGGATWSLVGGLDSVRLTLMFNSTGSLGVAAGDYGRIYETTDSGFTWNKVDPQYPLGSGSVNFWRGCFASDTVAILNSSQGFWRKTFAASPPLAVRASSRRDDRQLLLDARLSQGGDEIICKAYGLNSVWRDAAISCIVSDLLGRKMLDVSDLLLAHRDGPTSTFAIRTAGLPNGVYVLVLQVETSSTLTRMIVRH